MIVILHYLSLIIFQILRNRKRLKPIKNDENFGDGLEELDLENHLRFDPPLYRQRYSKVYEILLKETWRSDLKKLVDFGCAEYNLFTYIKSLNLTEILFVDIDETLLREKIGKIEPLLFDRLKRRSSPLEVSVFRGSVVDPDYRLRKTDVVTAVELIEHLYPDTLEAFPYNIFSFIRPKLVIITTPNADFNVVFNRKIGFRHPDHKFEWSRNQFKDWAINITERFPDYLVSFCGIGDPLPNYSKEQTGCCSQMAIFIRKDIFCNDYISPIYSMSCECDKSGPCRGLNTQSKLLCKCICPFCMPDFSVGICTYLSCNIKESEAYRPMKIVPNKSVSDIHLDKAKLQLYCIDANVMEEELHPSYNIFYKLVEKIEYPYEVDGRTEREKLIDLFKYRIRTFSYLNSRFYVEERERCEIPIRDIMYGDVNVSIEEVKHLLSENGCQIENCLIQETQEYEYCIVSMPQEMEDITSTSDNTDGYSSKSSDCNESNKLVPNNIESYSDWDELVSVNNDNKTVSEQDPMPSSSTEQPAKPKPDPLFDSGYLKSPSPLEVDTNLPQMQDVKEIPNQFENNWSTVHLCDDDNKLNNLKKTVAKEKFLGGFVAVAECNKVKVDPNRVNELDRFHNMTTVKTFMSNHLRPQTEFKKCPFKDLPSSVAGSSSSWKKGKKVKDKKPIELKEPTALDDAKSLTNCIIQNSLNIVQVEPEVIDGHQSPLIRDLSPLQDIPEPVELIQEMEPPVVAEPEAPVVAVENGDLANNNRDNEGNNLVVNQEEEDIDEGIDLLNDNLEDLPQPLEDNMPIVGNNNEFLIEVVQEAEAEQEAPPENLEDEDSVGRASREVLFDVNSVPDLLEDIDIPPQANQDDIFDMINPGHNLGNGSVVLVGIRSIDSDNREHSPMAAAIQTNSFPNWLLQILGSQMVPDEASQTAHASHDEPHFYCQGDGLGVHPSNMAVEVDEAEDADNDTTTTEESSSNNTADFAEVDPGPSDMFDMSSLPEESSLATSVLEERQNDNAGTIEGTELVNELIRAAEEEVNRRSRIALNEPNGECEEIAGGSESGQNEYSHQPDISHILYRSVEAIMEPLAQHSNNYQNEPDQERFNNSTLNGLTPEPIFELVTVESVNGSEKSEYFDPGIEEF